MGRRYNATAARHLQNELEPFAANANTAMSITTYLQYAGIDTLDQAASFSDAALLSIRGIGPKGVETIRLAHKCLHDNDEYVKFMVDKTMRMREELFRQREELDQRITKLEEFANDLVNRTEQDAAEQ